MTLFRNPSYLLFAVALASPSGIEEQKRWKRPDSTQAPVWPELFHATLLQNRSGNLALTDLYYDWQGGRNLNVIRSQLGSTLFDNEFSNGTTYYYPSDGSTCNAIEMGVGIVKPDWLAGAAYIGEATVDNIPCDVWQQGGSPDDDATPFVTYYSVSGAAYPARWVFYDGAQFDVLQWAVNETAGNNVWALPPSCFDGAGSDGSSLPGASHLRAAPPSR